MKRGFTAAPTAKRCAATVSLRDKSTAQCMRAAACGPLCRQHYRLSFDCCGGNDAIPTEHTQDCDWREQVSP